LDEFGWSRGSTALMLSLNILIYGLTAPFAGLLVDHWKPRKVLLVGVIILSFTTALCAFANELWHFYFLFGFLVPIGIAFSGWPVLAPTIANWFTKKRGLALGIGGMGAGISYVYGLFVEFVISQVGWHYAYVVIGILLLVILVPLYLILYHYRPKDRGLTPYGSDIPAIEKATGIESSGGVIPNFSEWTLRRAAKTYQLWLLITSHSLYWGMAAYLVLAHQVRFAIDAGYSSLFAASVFAMFGVFMTVGLLLGFISDWIGREWTVTLANLLAIGAIVALILVNDASQSWLLYIYAVCLGLGAGLFSPTITAGEADLFHGKSFGAIAGLSLAGVGVGSVMGPWLGGWIYDVSGSYAPAFFFCIVCFVLSLVAFWIAAPRNASRFAQIQK
jgi:MFS family permease